ncbi:4Fe-4S cluster-binding domain-containing protein [Sulfolobus sp. E5-1-F]|uniref:radical SAM protein n=1 Tax=Saccharolobus sp. E5-1-F TaxID=2663019 RepID=UPI00129636D9|nr:radical SAM protein [Sulfolobus sp. E5-1-F]QGA55090.1 4Fe-4S cluster-binding domain-containing protein [Sulfolobus sp. E5-1-F]
MTIIGNPEIGLYTGKLPKGCELCRLGGKLVLFITGECDDNCYYCPVSDDRFGKNRIFANETEVKDTMDIIYEAYRMKALGAGITGGDPILEIGRVTQIIEELKNEFGSDFHIHLYTTGRYVNDDVMKELVYAGLDEIRFHPIKEVYLNAVKIALKYDIDVGLELPAIPNEGDKIVRLVKWAEENNVKFVNLNELELNARNYLNLNSKGFHAKHGITGVEGSFDTAFDVLKKFEENKKITVHYCSSIYKDLVETRTRFFRIIKYNSKPYEEYTNEATIVRAIVKTNYKIPLLENFGEFNGSGEYSVSPSIIKDLLNEYANLIDEIYIVEEHPDSRRLRVGEKLIYSKSKNC